MSDGWVRKDFSCQRLRIQWTWMSPGPWGKPSSCLALSSSTQLFHFGFSTQESSFPLDLSPALNPRLEVSLPVGWWLLLPLPLLTPMQLVHCGLSLLPDPTQHAEHLSLETHCCSTQAFIFRSLPSSSNGKESACSMGDLGSIPGWGRSPGEGHGNPLQYSCLESPIWQRSLAGYSLWGLKESDTAEQLTLSRGQWALDWPFRGKPAVRLPFQVSWPTKCQLFPFVSQPKHDHLTLLSPSVIITSLLLRDNVSNSVFNLTQRRNKA